MRLKTEDGTPKPQMLRAVLSMSEARMLMESLVCFFESSKRPGGHHHLGSAPCELTIPVEDKQRAAAHPRADHVTCRPGVSFGPSPLLNRPPAPRSH